MKPDAKLAGAQDRFTRTKAERVAARASGTPISKQDENRYQKAKKDLWKERQKWRKKTYPDKDENKISAKAKPEALAVSGTPSSGG